LLEEYVNYVNYEDTNVQAAMLVANSLTSIGSGNEFILNNGNWVKKAENWTKYHIIASFAMVGVLEWIDPRDNYLFHRRLLKLFKTS
jgi:singapore isolate B (sub-type 7) whole genome shotgun sequence assembly, scaffold_1